MQGVTDGVMIAGRSVTTKVVLQMYCGLRAGTTVRDLCIQYNPHTLGIDERWVLESLVWLAVPNSYLVCSLYCGASLQISFVYRVP